MTGAHWALALRVSSISVGIYEYILTLPAEWNFYFGYRRKNRGWDTGAILFGLLRYVTIMVITFNNVGFLVGGFSARECERYYLIAPVLKVIQVMISQTILGLRAYGISGRNKRVKIFLLIFWIVCTVGEWVIGLYGREFQQGEEMNCVAKNDPHRLYTWGFYLIAMVYDLVTFCISCYYLMHDLPLDVYKASRFLRLLFFDGMQYFIALTAVNILNLIVYRNKDTYIQSSAAPFGYLITWIMSQRILIHMREGDKAGIHMSTEDLGLSTSGSSNDTRDRGRSPPVFEEAASRGEDTPGSAKSFHDISSPPSSLRRQHIGMADDRYDVRYPPGLP